MADFETVDIPGLPAASALTGAEITIVNQGGVTKRSTLTNESNFTLNQVDSAFIVAAIGFTPYNSTNPSGYITGINSGMVTTALGFTPYNATNPSGYITSSALTGYATQSYVNSQGFLTNITGIISAGTNISFTGTGTAIDPYVISASGGGGGGSLPSNEIGYGNGSSIISSSKFTRSSSTGLVSIGNSVTDLGTYRTDVDTMLTIGRSTDPTVNTNAHGMSDGSYFKKNFASLAYASWTGNVTYLGTVAYDHYAGYQTALVLGDTCTLGSAYGLTHNVSVGAGTSLTSKFDVYVTDGTGSGTITDQIGLQVNTLTKGSSKNYAINVQSNDSNFGGNIRFTTSGSSTGNLTPALNFYHANSFKTAYIVDKLNANSSSLQLYVAGSSLVAARLILELNGDDLSNTGSGSSTATLNGTLQFTDVTNTNPLNGQIWFEGGVFKKRQGGTTTNL